MKPKKHSSAKRCRDTMKTKPRTKKKKSKANGKGKAPTIPAPAALTAPHHPDFKPLPQNPAPRFEPFVEKWGLRGKREPQMDEEMTRALVGRYLHPKVAKWITSVQDAFDTGRFPYRSYTHQCCMTNPVLYSHDEVLADMRKTFGSVRRVAARKERKHGTPDLVIGMPVSGSAGTANSTIEKMNRESIKEIGREHRSIREKSRRLAHAMLAAVACRDVTFFKHIVEILSVMGTRKILGDPPPVIPARVAVGLAGQELICDDELYQLKMRLGALPRVPRVLLQFMAQNDYGIKSARRFDVTEFETKLDELKRERPEVASLLPEDWGTNRASCLQMISRHAKILGFRLNRSNGKKPKIRKRG